MRISRRQMLSAALGVGAAALVAFGWSGSSQAQNPTEMNAVAPELGGGAWLNTPRNQPISLKSRRGKVTLVQFWTSGHEGSLANLPAYARLYRHFAPRGLEAIGVHTPRSDAERDPAAVAHRVKELGISYPVQVDSKNQDWQRWGQRDWPTVYLIDKTGRARFKWVGELENNGAGGEAKLASLIQELHDESTQKVRKSEDEWRAQLTPEQFDVLRQKGTEPPFTGALLHAKGAGIFSCAGCGQALFSSATKFESGTGWPSFWKPIARGAVHEEVDNSYGVQRTEVLCSRCDGHLGHVFNDGPAPTGLRYCMNSAAMTFKKK